MKTLAEIYELDALRTQGEWEHEGMLVTCNTDCPYHPIADCSENHTCKGDEEFESNAKFIAAAPDMITHLKSQEAEIERLRGI